jgi:hypothetical protein
MYDSPKSDSKVIQVLSPMTKVKFLNSIYDSDKMLAEIEYNGNKGYVDINSVQTSERGVITGEKVRFRKEPNTNSEILLEFSKYTEVGILNDERSINWKFPGWSMISYQGKIGYVSRDFLVY